METPFQCAERMVIALEEFTAQESVLIRSRDLAEAVQISGRAAPLIEKLYVLAADPEVAGLRSRVEKLVAQRRRHSTELNAHMARLQSELHRINAACKRLARVAPVYAGASVSTESRLNTAA